MAGNFAMDCPGAAGYIRQSMHLELRPEAPPGRRARPPAGPRGNLLPGLLRVVPLLAALIFALAAALAVAQSSSFDPAEIDDSRDRVLSGGGYQTEMPKADRPPERLDFSIPPWLAEILFWGLVIVVGLVVAWFLFQLIADLVLDRSPFKRNRERTATAPERVETPVMPRRPVDAHSLAEADRLAAEGRFAEAIHLLLLVAMTRLHGELGPRVPPAMTGREILRLPSLPAATVAPLTRMVQLSEIKHFGGRQAAEPDYRAARGDYLAFTGEASVPA